MDDYSDRLLGKIYMGAARSLKGAEIQSMSRYVFFCQTFQLETWNPERETTY